MKKPGKKYEQANNNRLLELKIFYMASSFITMDDIHGFWVRDSLMQVVCWGLVNVIDDIQDNDFWAKGAFREHIFDNSQGIFIGFMDISLDEYLISVCKKTMLFSGSQ